MTPLDKCGHGAHTARIPKHGHGTDMAGRMKNGQRLDDKLVRALPAPEKGAKITYDADVSGFGVRVTAAGARAFILNYRIAGRERRYTIGAATEWKATAARKFAAEMKARIRLGYDPLAELEQDRTAPTVADLCDRFERDHLPRLRPNTQKLYRQAIHGTASRKGIRQHFKHHKVEDLRHSDVEGFHRLLSRSAPMMANRTLAVMSRMLGLAVRWGWRADNPARGTERNQEVKRSRYLSTAEIKGLTVALAALADQQAANVFRLMLLTGCRKGEALAARWDQIDLTAGLWIKPGSTTKQKTEHRVPLSAAAVALLNGIERESEWVFPGRVTEDRPIDEVRHRTEIKAQWERVCAAAGLVDASGGKTVRMHDLRHTYASVLASAGLSLPIIGALLGHSQPATTARYAHLMDDPLRQATERAAALVTGSVSADVVKLEAGK
jgi:integrase